MTLWFSVPDNLIVLGGMEFAKVMIVMLLFSMIVMLLFSLPLENFPFFG
jgi:hypothetical protein